MDDEFFGGKVSSEDALVRAQETLDFCQDELHRVTVILELARQDNSEIPHTREEFEKKLFSLMECSMNVSCAISIMTLCKTDILKNLRIKKSYSNMHQISEIVVNLKDNIRAYSGISFNLGQEMSSVKEMLKIKFCNPHNELEAEVDA